MKTVARSNGDYTLSKKTYRTRDVLTRLGDSVKVEASPSVHIALIPSNEPPGYAAQGNAGMLSTPNMPEGVLKELSH